MAEGAETTKSYIINEIYARVKDLEHNGGTFCKITRERVDAQGRQINDMGKAFEEFMETHRENVKLQTYMIFSVVALSFVSGGTLAYNILKQVFHIL